jgi:PhnB protein
VNVQTYLFFDGRCDQALELYQKALGAEILHRSYFSDAPEFLRSPERDKLIFHSTIHIGEAFLNMSDDPMQEKGCFGGFALLVHMDSPEQVQRTAAILATDGTLEMPPQSVPWADLYAVVTDRFGVTWKLQA